ncbi:PhnE/PtxC family ABC transporter permease [Mycoplasmopsis primatum]|uniref:PhnE/PtxC family ABC transporter permease n=1 Tax=Mycoplasmopsis primatum TaxID=55604 RepID=UPI00068976D3|nr:hypothetical protein [Mycoplasmopsis primatum]
MWNSTNFRNWKLKIKKNSFTYQIEDSKQNHTRKKLRPFFVHLICFIAIIVFFWFLSNINLSLNKYGWKVFKTNITNFFNFSSTSTVYGGLKENLWTLSIKFMLATVKYAIAGTFIGFLFAVLTAFLCNKNFVNKYWSFIPRNLMLILRAVPELVFINMFIHVYYKYATLVFIFIWFTWLWLHKYFIEILNSIDNTPYLMSIYRGNSKTKAFFTEIYPRIVNRFVNLGFYSLESNIKWNTILGALGVMGIGSLIKHASDEDWSQLGIPLFIMILFIVSLEILSYFLKKYFFDDRTRKIEKNTNEKSLVIYKKISILADIKYWIKIFIFIVLAIFSVSVILVENTSFKDFEFLKMFVKKMFSPDYSDFNLLSLKADKNPILLVLQSMIFAILSVILSFITLLIVLFYSNSKINRAHTYVSIRSLTSFFRVIPSPVVFLIFSPLFNHDYSLLILVLGFHESSSLIKQISEATDNIDNDFINNLKMQGYSNLKIYIRFIIPIIKYDLASWFFFYLEMSFRNSITYSVYSQQGLVIGSKISNYMDARIKQFEKAFSYIWLATLSILILNLISEFIIDKRNKNKWFKKTQ